MHSTEDESTVQNRIFYFDQPFTMESGKTIPGFHLSYTTIGKLNEDKSNVIWIFHALTANSNPAEWWPGMVGVGKLFDPEKHFILCVNMPGSCYGSTGPLDINPQTGEPWYHSFQFFTTRDMVRTYQHLKNALGISKVKLGIGGSMGGQQLLEFAIEEPQLFEYIIPIATNASHSPWGRAFNAAQRIAIEADPSWKEQKADAGINGMKAARSIALISYRHYSSYDVTQQDNDEQLEGFKSESYQQYQGEKLAKRFNAFSYYVLSKGMDAHNVGRGRGSIKEVLKTITAKTLVIGIETDILFPVNEQEFLANEIPGARLAVISSAFGHDGFLLEYDKINQVITAFTGAL
jgi:homoserine O-acetyltransferase/O-succinyltransferase